jgi:hypothetical protein
MRKIESVAGLFALSLPFLLAGCSKQVVTIRYAQPANCGNTVGEFAFFRITSIENNDAQAVDFHFAVNKIGVSGHTWELQQSDPRFIAVDTVVPAHTTLSPVPRDGIVMLSVRSVSPNEYGAFQNLTYASSGSESVLLVRNGGSNPPPPKVVDPSGCNGSTVPLQVSRLPGAGVTYALTRH